jgi:hypothetical protein
LQIEWNPWLGGYSPHISVLSAHCPKQNVLNPPPPPEKISEYATATEWEMLRYNLLSKYLPRYYFPPKFYWEMP